MRRARGHRLRRALALVALVAAAWGAATIALVLARPEPAQRRALGVPVRAPSRAALTNAIDSAARYDAALYRSLPGGNAVMSEYLALPLRVQFESRGRWVLLGENGASRIIHATSARDSETEDVEFTAPGGGGTVRLHVQVLWAATPHTYELVVQVVSLPRAAGPVRIDLGGTPIGNVNAGGRGTTISRSFDRSDTAPLRAFRWTVRHGVQEGHNFFLSRGDPARAERLGRFMKDLGFIVDYDITAPIWHRGVGFGDDMPYDFDPRGGSAYHDCDAHLPATDISYPYRSKVCRISLRAYVWSTHFDTLVPTAQALHVLNRHGDPDRRYRVVPVGIGEPLGLTPLDRSSTSRTPRSTAAELERRFRRLGFGMPRCSPTGCDAWASSVRTFQFGALEAMLGYRYGDAISRRYADRVAAIALAVQVGQDGVLRRPGAGPLVRPATAGSFLLAWDSRFRLAVTSNLVSGLTAQFDMPPEYRGVIPSNAETSLTAYAFLVLYRCERYGVGCAAANLSSAAQR